MTILATEAAGDVAAADIGGDVAAGSRAGSTSKLAQKPRAGPKGQRGRTGASGKAGKSSVRTARDTIAGTSQSAGPRTSARLSQPGKLSQQFPSGRSSRTSSRTGGGSRKRSSGLPKLSKSSPGNPTTAALIVEWLIAVLVIFWQVLDGKDQYLDAASKALWRMSALSGVFFVLALVMRGKNTGRVALAFGAIIDLAVILQAAKSGSVKALADTFSGTGTGGNTTDVVLTDKQTGKTTTTQQDNPVVEETQHEIGQGTVGAAATDATKQTDTKPKAKTTAKDKTGKGK